MKKLVFLFFSLFFLSFSYAINIQWELRYGYCYEPSQPGQYINKKYNNRFAKCFHLNDYQNSSFYYMLDKKDLNSIVLKSFIWKEIKVTAELLKDYSLHLSCDACKAYRIYKVWNVELMSKEEKTRFTYYKNNFISHKKDIPYKKYKSLSYGKKVKYAVSLIKKIWLQANKKTDKLAYYKTILSRVEKAELKLKKLIYNKKNSYSKVLLYKDVNDILVIFKRMLRGLIQNEYSNARLKQEVLVDKEYINIYKYLSTSQYTEFDKAVLKWQQKYIVKYVDKVLELLDDIYPKIQFAYNVNWDIKFTSSINKSVDTDIKINDFNLLYKNYKEKLNLKASYKNEKVDAYIDLEWVLDYKNYKSFIKYNKFLVDNKGVESFSQSLWKWILFEKSKKISNYIKSLKEIREILNTKPLVRELPKSLVWRSNVIIISIPVAKDITEKLWEHFDNSYIKKYIKYILNWKDIYYQKDWNNYIVKTEKIFYHKNEYFDVSFNKYWELKYIKWFVDRTKIDITLNWNSLNGSIIEYRYDNPDKIKEKTIFNWNIEWDIKFTYYKNGYNLTEEYKWVLNIEKLKFETTVKNYDFLWNIKIRLKDLLYVDVNLRDNMDNEHSFYLYYDKNGKFEYKINAGSYKKIIGSWKWTIAYCKTDFKGDINLDMLRANIILKDSRQWSYCNHNYIIKSIGWIADIEVKLKSKKSNYVSNITLPTDYISYGEFLKWTRSVTWYKNESDISRKASLFQMSTALVMYFSDYWEYPEWRNTNDLKSPLKSYINHIPTDPQTKEPYFYRVLTSNWVTKAWYILWAKMENPKYCNLDVSSEQWLEKLLKQNNYELTRFYKFMVNDGSIKTPWCYYVMLRD